MSIREYESYLTLERGMADNTREAYVSDACRLMEFLDEKGIKPEDATEENLHEFLCTLRDLGIGPRSQARVLSGVKSYFKFLKLSGFIGQNPTDLLESPRLGRHLPEVLSIQEIDNMIGCIDDAKEESLRNHAIIETLYGSGLRVSELTDARLSRINMDDGYMIVEGKEASNGLCLCRRPPLPSSRNTCRSGPGSISSPIRKTYCFLTGGVAR